jgi:hypothetical protein
MRLTGGPPTQRVYNPPVLHRVTPLTQPVIRKSVLVEKCPIPDC